MRLVVPNNAVRFRNPRLNHSRNIRLKSSGAALRQFFRDNFQPEVASGIISGATVDKVGVGISVKFGQDHTVL